MKFDSTISLGTLLSGLIVVASVFIAAWRIGLQMKRDQWKVNMMWEDYKKEHGIKGNNGPR